MGISVDLKNTYTSIVVDTYYLSKSLSPVRIESHRIIIDTTREVQNL